MNLCIVYYTNVLQGTRGAHFEKNWIWLGDTYFEPIFHKDLKNVTLFKKGSSLLMYRHCLACLLNFTKQASWAELAR